MPSDNAGILAQQKAWLDKLQTISKKPITVKAVEGNIPDNSPNPDIYRWMFFKDIWTQIKAPIWTRRILDNEIVFDPDVKNWQVLREEMNKLISFCRENSIPFYLAYTGGNGVHLSIYMKPVTLDSDVLEEAYEKDLDISKIIRQTVINYLLLSSKTDAKKIALDTKKYNFSKMRSGSQLREYGTPREHGGFKTLIDEIPVSKPDVKSLVLRFPDKLELWDISPISVKIDTAIQEEVERAVRNNDANLDPITLTDCKINSFPCIKALIDKGRSSARYYGGQSIALMMKKCGYTWESSEAVVQKYFKKCTDLTKAQIEKRLADVKNTATEYEYNFSCREFKEIFGKEYCTFNKCPISAKVDKAKADKERAKIATETNPQTNNEADSIIQKTNEIMEKGDPVKFLLDTHQKTHVGDENLAMSLLVSIGCQSVKNSDGIHPKVSGESGKGKTHCCRAMARLIPKEWRCETTLSDKAIYYIKMRPASVVFSDDTVLSETLEGIIKRATSNFQEGDAYQTVDAQRNPLTLNVPPRITWWLTSVDDNQSLQLLNRQFGGGVDDSNKQDKKVMDFQIQQAMRGEEPFPETEDTKICQEILRNVKSQLFKVKIPFIASLKWYDTENRRNLPVFLDIIKSLAVLRYKQRPINDGYLIAMPQDYFDARDLYCSRAENQKLKLSDGEKKICEYLRDVGEASTTTLCNFLKISYGRLSQIMGGKDGKSGLLEKVKGMTVERVSEKEDTKTTHKKMYALSGFNVFDSLGYIVEIDQKEIDDFTMLYPDFTPNFTTHTHTLIHTTTTVISEVVNTDLPKTQESTRQDIQDFGLSKKDVQVKSGENICKNLSVLKTVKTGKVGKVGSADNESREVKLGKYGGKFTQDIVSMGEQVKLAGVEWERINGASINSTNVTAFSIWYCQNKDSSKLPSDIKTMAVKVFAITPDAQNTKRFGVSHLCKSGQHKECGGYECGCDCH